MSFTHSESTRQYFIAEAIKNANHFRSVIMSKMTPNDIINEVARITGIQREEILGPYREMPICNARYLIAWGVKQIRPNYSQMQISRLFGKNTHGYGRDCLQRASELYVGCSGFRAIRDRLESVIQGREVAA